MTKKEIKQEIERLENEVLPEFKKQDNFIGIIEAENRVSFLKDALDKYKEIGDIFFVPSVIGYSLIGIGFLHLILIIYLNFFL
ncbi:MAG: hypothetical protein GY679_01870 [Mycoplasma sp.]|nr:hypothetical protein [Mycoplasma sp.]